MHSPHEFRLYTFVAGLYLSPLQRGLQTAHVVSEILGHDHGTSSLNHAVLEWARRDKTIIICDASNHRGVLDCWAELKRVGIDTGMVAGAIFHEDEESMNSMATACGVIVPRKYWDVHFFPETAIRGGGAAEDQVIGYTGAYWEHDYEKDGQSLQERYHLNYPEGQLISHLKKYRLAAS